MGTESAGSLPAVLVALKKIGIVVAFVYGAVCLTMFLMQTRLLFFPSPDCGPPAAYGLPDFSKASFRTSDDVLLTGWLHENPKRDKALVYFYGNADSLAGSAPLLRAFADAGYTVLGVNYRGYGGSEGNPSESGLYRDGDAALEFLKTFVPTENTVVLGRSLGSGVAVDLASRRRVKALALVSPYTSIPDVASEMYWFLPVRLLSRYAFASIDKIARVSAPMIVIHGALDASIPLAHGRALVEAATGPKRLSVFDGQGHNDLDLQRIAVSVVAFAGER